MEICGVGTGTLQLQIVENSDECIFIYCTATHAQIHVPYIETSLFSLHFPIIHRYMSHHLTHRDSTMVANPVQFGPGSDSIERNSKTDPDSSEDKIKKWFFLKLNQINNFKEIH